MRNFRLDDESGHQEALFSWAAYRTEIMPELQYMYHVPNGGKRDKATAAVLKRQGVKAGVQDIMLPAARAGYHGLYIELKAGENTTTKKQRVVRVSAAAGLLYRRLLRLAASSAADRAVFITFRRAYKRTGNSNHALGATQEREAKNENNKHFELKGRRSQDLYSGKHGV